jgi:hypothetical protein
MPPVVRAIGRIVPGETPRWAWSPIAAISFAILAAGCQGDAPARGSRDSLGIQIVESETGAWRNTGDGWKVDPMPIVDIGASDSAIRFSQITHVASLRGGRIAVAEARAAHVRIFDSTGRHLATLGRRGQGPGEFGLPYWVGDLAADTVLVVEPSRGFRLSLFTASGTFARANGGALKPGIIPVGRFSDTSFLARSEDPSPETEGDLIRTHSTALRIGRDGAILDSLGRFLSLTGGAGGAPYAWGPQGQYAVSDTTFYFGTGKTFEIGRYDRRGRLLQLIRLARPPRVPTEAEFTEWKAEKTRNVRGVQALQDRYANALAAPRFPAYFYLKVDAGGNLWVQEYTPKLGEGRSWSVFDRDGRYLGDVEMPVRVRVFEIGDDVVLGVRRDEANAEYVSRYRLIK